MTVVTHRMKYTVKRKGQYKYAHVYTTYILVYTIYNIRTLDMSKTFL